MVDRTGPARPRWWPPPDRPSWWTAAAGAHAGRGGRGRRANLTALLLTHLHSDHITDLSDVITTRWVTTFVPTAPPIIGPPGTAAVVAARCCPCTRHLLPHRPPRRHHRAALGTGAQQYAEGQVWDSGGVRITAARPTTAGPNPPSPSASSTTGASVVLAGDTVPCASLDDLARGANALVHTVIRGSVEQMPAQRIRDILDYHSSVEPGRRPPPGPGPDPGADATCRR